MTFHTRLSCHIYAVVFILLSAPGCTDAKSETSISYHATALSRDEAGGINEGRKQSSEAVFNESLHESSMEILVDENEKVKVTIKPGTGKSAHVTLNLNDQSIVLQINEGQMKNIIFNDSDIGIRIHIEEINP